MAAATVGVAEHGNSAVLITVGADGALRDRRRVDLTQDLPTHPYHHEGAWAMGRYRSSPWARDISLPEAVALIEQVRAAAAVGAQDALEALARDVETPISTLALRACPPLPPTIEATLADHRAETVADSVMYRQALAAAAAARGWSVRWYDRATVFATASAALGVAAFDAHLKDMGRAAGPPWRARQKLAAAAAIAARR